MAAYYNEIDPAAGHILRTLIDEGVIAPGIVDTRSIKEVHPDDLKGFTQCHFFAGGGLWSVAARLSGWPDDEPLWTASCPCQPFSAAGQGKGTDDPRHLWPDLYRLKRARRPIVCMGEQVAGKAGYGWFDGVSADLARENFASRTIDFPACSVDAPHQRNRQYWAAIDMVQAESIGRREGWTQPELWSGWPTPTSADAPSMANRVGVGQQVPSPRGKPAEQGPVRLVDQNLADGSGKPLLSGRSGEARSSQGTDAGSSWQISGRKPDYAYGRRNGTYWSDAEWIDCHDGKARRTKPGLRLLVNGLPGRVDLWRVGGNAIVPEAAAEVIAAFIDVYGLPSTWRTAA